MSKRRMFSQDIVMSDAFLDMPLSTQALYFHLSMNADDYGFISPKRIMRMVGANDDDLKVLIAKRFVLAWDSGVVVIKHWQINNTVRKDRSHETTYQDEFKALTFNEYGAYTEVARMGKVADEIATVDKHIRTAVVEKMQGQVDKSTTNEQISQGSPPDGGQMVDKMATEIRLDKTRLDKISNNPPAVAKPEPVAKETIDELLTYWTETIGYAVGNELGNRRAIAPLVRQHGVGGLKRLVQGVAKAHSDRYAPRISDFVSLKRKQNDLIVWGKQQISSGGSKVTKIS